MMMKINNSALRIIMLFILTVVQLSCKKQNEWLDIKNNKSNIVPTTLPDLQALLNNNYVTTYIGCTAISINGTDNVLVKDGDLETISTVPSRNAYLWKKDLLEGNLSYDFSYCYIVVAYSNIVLDGLKKIEVTTSNSIQHNTLKGGALFSRSMMFFNLSQLFCKPYNKSTSNNDLGLQLRTAADPNIVVKRSSVEETYQQMISDLITAADLLPIKGAYPTSASKVAAYALLAKTYLVMGEYEKARIYANKVLAENGQLIDFNDYKDSSNDTVFPVYSNAMKNLEVLYYSSSLYDDISIPYGLACADLSLVNSYDENDLRKQLFFKKVAENEYKISGSYTGDYSLFTGIGTNEIYLIRAECNARLEANTNASMLDMNTLLRKRFVAGSYTDKIIENKDEALKFVLSERRKELPFTSSIRWQDLRRLNLDPRFVTTIIRVYKGQTYILKPNSSLYVFPFPDQEIRLSGVEQNLR